MDYVEPDFLPWDGRRVPMTFVAGYLGAGKTTLLNEVLAQTEASLAILVNDVGEINIDAALIRRRDGDTIELTDGCVCCSLSDGFGAAIDGLRARPDRPDHVIVELSGVAQVSRVLPWARSAGFTLDGVVTVVDAEWFEERLATAISATTVVDQIVSADLIVMTKTDLASAPTRRRVERRLTELAPGVPIVSSARGPGATVIGLGARGRERLCQLPQPRLFDRHRVTTVPIPRPIERSELERLVDELPADVLRAKGIAREPDGGHLLIQVVGRRRSITELPTPEIETPTDLVVISADEPV